MIGFEKKKKKANIFTKACTSHTTVSVFTKAWQYYTILLKLLTQPTSLRNTVQGWTNY